MYRYCVALYVAIICLLLQLDTFNLYFLPFKDKNLTIYISSVRVKYITNRITHAHKIQNNNYKITIYTLLRFEMKHITSNF